MNSLIQHLAPRRGAALEAEGGAEAHRLEGWCRPTQCRRDPCGVCAGGKEAEEGDSNATIHCRAATVCHHTEMMSAWIDRLCLSDPMLSTMSGEFQRARAVFCLSR